jgi:PAS domain S-box-containing protein
MTTFPEEQRWTGDQDGLLQLLVESVTDYAIFVLDPAGTVASWNPGARRIKQYDAEEIVGQHFSRFYPREAIERGWPDYELKVAREEGRFEDEGWRVRKDGSQFWANVVITALHDEQGVLKGFAKITRDLTERRATEEREKRLAVSEAAHQAAEIGIAQFQAGEERLKLFVEHAPAAVAMLDREMRYLLVSRRWLTDYGLRRDAVIGRSHYEVFPDLPEEWLAVHRRCLGGSTERCEEDRFVRTDGSVRWLRWEILPWRDATGAIGGILIFAEDITARKRADESLRVSEERFRQLANAMPQIVWTADASGRVDYLNQRWTEFTGVPTEVSNEGWGGVLHPDEAATAGRLWQDSLERGVPFEAELRLKHHEGGYRWHLLRTVPVADSAGRIVRWYGTATEIQQQKRVEETSLYLAEASAELALAVDYESTLQKVANLAVPYFADWSAVDAVEGNALRRLAVAHTDPQKIELAHALMRHYPTDLSNDQGTGVVVRTGESLLISDITDEMLVQGARDEQHLDLIRQLGLRSYICVPLIVSGRVYAILTFATAESGRHLGEGDLRLAKDLAYRASIAVQNIQLLETLRLSDRRKDEFIATLAHELRNPLAPIRTGIQVLDEIGSQNAEAIEIRRIMDRQLTHMVRLVDDLMDVSRISTGRLELRKEHVELASVVQTALEAIRPQIEEAGHQLTVSLPEQPVKLYADPVRLSQVLSNLLSNSSRYTDNGGSINLDTEVSETEVTIRVRDNGQGIPAESLSRIFEMFIRGNHLSPSSTAGLGIGLTLVKRLVELHGGRVTAVSEGVGKGSEFKIVLPVELPSRQTTFASDHEATPDAGKTLRVLVVDDNVDAATTLAALLRHLKHDVHVTHDGESAVARAAELQPHVILLDIGLPGLNGYEACRRIRQQPEGSRPRIIALTGWGLDEDRRRSQEAGFDHHLVKPVSLQSLQQSFAIVSELRS